ncbi:MAG: hypothetical protein WDO56_00070 [Gammaproteobacteria bacterium]
MTKIVTPADLEHLTETELRSKFFKLTDELLYAHVTAAEADEITASLKKVRDAIHVRKARGPKI